VIGVPSERWGETPLAVVVPRAGSEPDAAAIAAGQRAGREAAARERRHVQGLAAAQPEWQDPQARAARGLRPPRGGVTEHYLDGTAWRDCYFESSDRLMLYYASTRSPTRTACRGVPARAHAQQPRFRIPGAQDAARRATGARAGPARPRRSQYDPNWTNYHPALPRRHRGAAGGADAERVVVVGTSLGGILAMLIAATRPAAIAGAVLNDVGPEIAPEACSAFRSTWDGPRRHQLEEAAAQTRATYELALPDLTDEEWLAYARRSYVEVEGQLRLAMDPMIGEAVRAAPPERRPTSGRRSARWRRCRRWRCEASSPTSCRRARSSAWAARSRTCGASPSGVAGTCRCSTSPSAWTPSTSSSPACRRRRARHP